MFGCILCVRFNYFGIKFMVWCVYFLMNVVVKDFEKVEVVKMLFYCLLDKFVKVMKKDYLGYYCIIVGDWNVIIGCNVLKIEYVGFNFDDYDIIDNGD